MPIKALEELPPKAKDTYCTQREVHCFHSYNAPTLALLTRVYDRCASPTGEQRAVACHRLASSGGYQCLLGVPASVMTLHCPGMELQGW